MTARRGQVALYLVVVLVAITILTLANVGTFLAVRAKNHAMNAGDAAAIAAAKRQGELLNEIGRLNLQHAEEELRQLVKPPEERDWDAARAKILEIIRKQRRIAFLGPLDCVRVANEAAKDNGAMVSEEMSRILRTHVGDITSKYKANPDLYPEPWDGAWDEYAAELSSVIGGGLAAGPDNVEFLDAVECFPLTSKSFYSMIEGEAWCKLVVMGLTALLDMDLHNLPQPVYGETAAVVNSEVCSLHLSAHIPLVSPALDESLRDVFVRNGASFPEESPAEDDRPLDDPSRVYFFYDEAYWCEWSALIAKANLPLAGSVKPEFDVKGCASVFRVIEDIPRLLAETTRRSSWNAAAKPFGTIMTSSGRSVVTDEEAMGLVLPAFEAVRLVPVCLADDKDLSTADAAWLDHVREHVPRLLTDGEDGLSASCRYCSLLKRWNDPDFRSRAASWIAANAETCLRGKGGPGPSGGTSYAH